MVELRGAERALYEQILARITALCKGFLLVADRSIEKACSFCRGLLILVEQLLRIMPKARGA